MPPCVPFGTVHLGTDVLGILGAEWVRQAQGGVVRCSLGGAAGCEVRAAEGRHLPGRGQDACPSPHETELGSFLAPANRTQGSSYRGVSLKESLLPCLLEGAQPPPDDALPRGVYLGHAVSCRVLWALHGAGTWEVASGLGALASLKGSFQPGPLGSPTACPAPGHGRLRAACTRARAEGPAPARRQVFTPFGWAPRCGERPG